MFNISDDLWCAAGCHLQWLTSFRDFSLQRDPQDGIPQIIQNHNSRCKKMEKMLLTQSTAHFPSSALVVSGLSSQINLAIVFRTKSTCKPLLKSVQHHRRMEKEIWGKLQELHMQTPIRIWLKICHRQNESRHPMSEHQHQQRVSWLNGMVILRFPIFPTQSCLILLCRFGS